MGSDLFLDILTVSKFKAESWLITYSNANTQRKVVEIFSHCALLTQKINQNLANTFSMCKHSLRNSLVHALEYHCLLSQSSGRAAEEDEAIIHGVDVVKRKILEVRGTENVGFMPW